MLPRGIPHLLYTFASAAAALIAHKDTPDPLRQELRNLIKKLSKNLPKWARREIAAAEAEATIRAADYLRRES